jgi:hypothetical protein
MPLGESGTALRARITSDLEERGLELDPVQAALLDEACVLADHLAELDAAVAELGVVVQGSRGQPVVNPASQEARLVRLAMARLLRGIDLDEDAPTPRQRQARAAAKARYERRG